MRIWLLGVDMCMNIPTFQTNKQTKTKMKKQKRKSQSEDLNSGLHY